MLLVKEEGRDFQVGGMGYAKVLGQRDACEGLWEGQGNKSGEEDMMQGETGQTGTGVLSLSFEKWEAIAGLEARQGHS